MFIKHVRHCTRCLIWEISTGFWSLGFLAVRLYSLSPHNNCLFSVRNCMWPFDVDFQSKHLSMPVLLVTANMKRYRCVTCLRLRTTMVIFACISWIRWMLTFVIGLTNNSSGYLGNDNGMFVSGIGSEDYLPCPVVAAKGRLLPVQVCRSNRNRKFFPV